MDKKKKIKKRSKIKMGEKTYSRFDISDPEWELLEPQMTGQPGQHGGIAKDNRKFINAVVWILKTGSPWRDLPPNYGKWGTVHQRFIRWQQKGMWKKLFEILKGDKNFEWLMLDSIYVKAHQHAVGARGGNQAISKTNRGLNSKIHLAVNERSIPIKCIVTEGTRADCKEAINLLKNYYLQIEIATLTKSCPILQNEI